MIIYKYYYIYITIVIYSNPISLGKKHICDEVLPIRYGMMNETWWYYYFQITINMTRAILQDYHYYYHWIWQYGSEILHQLRDVVYPIIGCGISSKVVQDFATIHCM